MTPTALASFLKSWHATKPPARPALARRYHLTLQQAYALAELHQTMVDELPPTDANDAVKQVPPPTTHQDGRSVAPRLRKALLGLDSQAYLARTRAFIAAAAARTAPRARPAYVVAWLQSTCRWLGAGRAPCPNPTTSLDSPWCAAHQARAYVAPKHGRHRL